VNSLATRHRNYFLSGGIPADKKSLIEIIAADHDTEWSELETAAESDAQEDE
jgi:hypothetical protein